MKEEGLGPLQAASLFLPLLPGTLLLLPASYLRRRYTPGLVKLGAQYSATSANTSSMQLQCCRQQQAGAGCQHLVTSANTTCCRQGVSGM